MSKAVTKVFKLIFKKIQSFHEKSHFYFDSKKFWVVENSKSVSDMFDQTNTKQNAKPLSAFDFSTLYTILPHKNLLKVLFHLNDFGFKGDSKKKS